ncbi:MAG: glycosyltransferase family 2 protein [Vicinamibacteria bacterium]
MTRDCIVAGVIGELLLAAAGLLWLGFGIAVRGSARRLRPLPEHDPAHDRDAPPLVSVVLAVRNEAEHIERTVRHLFAQRATTLEIVVADDRSDDATPAVLARLQQEWPHLRVVRIESLPDGWLGKCHALHEGARQATADWLLFVDGDVWLRDDVVRRAVEAAGDLHVAHLALTPDVRPVDGRAPSFAFQACLIPLQALLGLAIDRANRDHPRGFAGIGAFNMIRADVYRGFGGHHAIRMDVADDMKLGLLVRRAGQRTRVFLGGEDAHCPWAVDVRGIVRVLEKNNFAAVEYRTGRAVAATLGAATLWLAGVLGPFSGGPGGLLAGLGLLSLSAGGIAIARADRFSPLAGLLMPLMLSFGAVTLWNSVLATLRQGGIRWRGTFYPLEALRRGALPFL